MQSGKSKVWMIFAVAGVVGCSDDESMSASGPSSGLSNVSSAGESGESLESSGDESSGGADGTGDPTESGSESAGDEPLLCNPADDLEPNDIEDEAMVLPNIDDSDASGSLVESILAGDGDVDWFAYMGQDVAFAYVDPTADLAADEDLRLCLFVECLSGPTIVPTCVNSIYDESPNGLRGCCNSGIEAEVSIDLDCDSGDDNAYVFMRVDHGHSKECVPYAMAYHY